MSILHLITLLGQLAFAAPCDQALERAQSQGVLEPSELYYRQRCQDTVSDGRKSWKVLSVCLLVGVPKASHQELYGDKPVIVAYAEDPASEEHFKSLIGAWVSGKRTGPGKGEQEAVTVSVGNAIATVVIRRSRERASWSEIQKIQFNPTEKYLRFEKSRRSLEGSKLLSASSFECEQSASQQELDEQERKSKGDVNAKLKSVPGSKNIRAKKPGHRDSGISGGKE